jgi:hypothetical protein
MQTKKKANKELTSKIITKIQEALNEVNTKAVSKMEKAMAKKAKALTHEISAAVKKVTKKEQVLAKKNDKQTAKNPRKADKPSKQPVNKKADRQLKAENV